MVGKLYRLKLSRKHIATDVRSVQVYRGVCNTALGYLGKRQEANIAHVELVVEYSILYGWKRSWLPNGQNKSSVGKDRERIKGVRKRYCFVYPLCLSFKH